MSSLFSRAALDVDFARSDFEAQVGAVLKEYGVVVITNMFSSEECDATTDALVSLQPCSGSVLFTSAFLATTHISLPLHSLS